MSFKPTSSNYKTVSALSEINVTPLVDVMLVLLIIFMISAPLMQQGVQVELPKANTGSMSETPEQLVLLLTKTKQIQLGGTILSLSNLKTHLEVISSSKPNTEIVIQADQSLPYGFVAQVMGEIKKAKIHRLGLATETEEAQRK